MWKLSSDAECKLEALGETAREVIIRKERVGRKETGVVLIEKGGKRDSG